MPLSHPPRAQGNAGRPIAAFDPITTHPISQPTWCGNPGMQLGVVPRLGSKLGGFGESLHSRRLRHFGQSSWGKGAVLQRESRWTAARGKQGDARSGLSYDSNLRFALLYIPRPCLVTLSFQSYYLEPVHPHRSTLSFLACWIGPCLSVITVPPPLTSPIV